MPEIKFNQLYRKLLDPEGEPIASAKLLMVFTISQDNLTTLHDFLHYETDGHVTVLPFSEFWTVLVFKKEDNDGGDLFTSIRPSHSKFGSTKEYYSKFIGQDFKITIIT